MKTAFIFAVLVGVAVSEDCTTVSDCSHVTCPDRNYRLMCDHTICSCQLTTTHSCLTAGDCKDNLCQIDFHCIDSTCRCGHGFGPAPGGGHAPDGGHAPGGK